MVVRQSWRTCSSRSLAYSVFFSRPSLAQQRPPHRLPRHVKLVFVCQTLSVLVQRLIGMVVALLRQALLLSGIEFAGPSRNQMGPDMALFTLAFTPAFYCPRVYVVPLRHHWDLIPRL